MKLLKEVPDFQNEDEEFEFWATHDSSEYVDWPSAKRIFFPNLEKSSDLVPVDITASALAKLKALAAQKSTNIESLIDQYLMEGINRDSASHRPA